MFIEADTHCHTIASDHAYCTVMEMASYAASHGYKAIAVTDHGPQLPDGAHIWHFGNLKCLPPFIDGVRVLHGAEANITDFEGGLDLPQDCLERLDWVIASFHEPVVAPGTVEQHTNAYLKLSQNPFVDVIGHSGGDHYHYDYEKVIPVLKKKKILVEINSHSFEARPGSAKNCREIALCCKKFEAPVVVNSDAHSCFSIGEVDKAFEMLDAIGFPRGLIVNLTFERLAAWIMAKRHINIMK